MTNINVLNITMCRVSMSGITVNRVNVRRIDVGNVGVRHVYVGRSRVGQFDHDGLIICQVAARYVFDQCVLERLHLDFICVPIPDYLVAMPKICRAVDFVADLSYPPRGGVYLILGVGRNID